MKQIESIFTLILTFTILSSTYSACVGPNPQLDLMETGTHNITKELSNCYNQETSTG